VPALKGAETFSSPTMPKQAQSHSTRGVFAALATPRRPDSTEVDAASFFDYQDGIIKAGVDGLVIFGSTGEFVHFDVSDRVHAVSLLSKRSRVPVLVNVSHSTIEGALTLADGALMAKAVGLLIMPPYFYRYTEAQLLAFYRRFAERIDGRTQLFLYNLPFFTTPLSFPLIEELLTSGLYAGIKDSSGERELFQQLSALHASHPFLWFAGNESLFLEACRAGAEGVVSGVASAVPELIVAIHRAVGANAYDLGTHLNTLLGEFLEWLDRFPATVAIKQTAVVRGWKLDQSAFQFDSSTQSEIKKFHRWLEDWLPRTLAECAESARLKA
jgi:4-hydroxy-tetrahydrodipicolinate synthase